MAFVSATTNNEAVQKFLEILQNDFRTLANETKKKYPQIREVRITKNKPGFALMQRFKFFYFSIYRFFSSLYLSSFCTRFNRWSSLVKKQS